jgi:hypothetical protein
MYNYSIKYEIWDTEEEINFTEPKKVGWYKKCGKIQSNEKLINKITGMCRQWFWSDAPPNINSWLQTKPLPINIKDKKIIHDKGAITILSFFIEREDGERLSNKVISEIDEKACYIKLHNNYKGK